MAEQLMRAQLKGSTASINSTAGYKGVLVLNTDTNHLHVLTGEAGNNIELANKTDIPAPVDISGKADRTYVDTELAKKQAKGDYATNSALTSGLAGKANSSHTHTKSQITDFPTIPDTSTLIPKSGNRGALAGYSSSATGTTVNATSGDSLYASTNVTVANGATGQTWTKVVKLSAGTVTLGTNWSWVGGEAPELKYPCLLVCHWNQDKGIAGIVAGVA